MAFVNNYVPPPPPPPVVLPDPSKPYDINFCFAVKDLETDRVRLTPFIPHLHAAALFNAISTAPEVMRYMPYPTLTTLEAFEMFCEGTYRLDSSKCMYVILDKTNLGPGDEADSQKVNKALMGTVSYINSSRELSTVEPGFIVILPQFQRTHVNTHAVGLLMQYALNRPSEGDLAFVGANGKPMPVTPPALGRLNAWDSIGNGPFPQIEKVVHLSELMTHSGYLVGTQRCWLFAGTTGRMEGKSTYSDLWIGKSDE